MNQFWRTRKHGVTLIEVVASLALLSLTLLPLTAIITRNSLNNRNSGSQGNNAMVVESEMAKLDPEQPSFYSTYDMGTTKDSTTYTDTGDAAGIPVTFLRKVDTANSTSMKRRVVVYLYKNSTDATNSPFTQVVQDLALNDLYYDCGLSSTLSTVDASDHVWHGDAIYNNANSVQGYVTGYGGTAGSVVNTITGVAADTQPVYRSYREGGELRFSFNVDPGQYTVQLLFAEVTNTVTGTSPNRRRMDIWVGDTPHTTLMAGSAAITSYSTCEVFSSNCGAGTYDRPHILTFDQTVGTNKVINIGIKRSSTSDLDARVAGIIISRK